MTPCATPRPPRATIGALHGVAGAIVLLDDTPAAPAPTPAAPAAPVRVTIRDCALTPSSAVATIGATLELQSQDEPPHAITITELGPAWLGTTAPAPAPAAPAAPAATRAQLPAWGHTVSLPLPSPGIWRITADGSDDAAYVAVTAAPAAVTGTDGAATLAAVPPGAHSVVAWLPPAAGQPALTVRGQATVVAGDRVDLTLRLAP